MRQLNADEGQGASEQTSMDYPVRALYDRHASMLLSYVYSQVFSQQDAEDLLLEVFVAALNDGRLAHLNDEQQLAWLRRVARNKVIDYYRHASVLSMLPLELAQEMEDNDPAPEQRAIRREQYEHLYRALERLSPLEQQLIRLRYGNGLRLVEIAQILEKPDGTVRKLLARTLLKLRAGYEQQEKGGKR
ncbi:MAG TPA: sigma-70 family RNA polymerase sigma factor [Ktedonobacteraceae bacterium]|jgi:RNA polymerase sigma factor (sigma-70 family)|nr:sigma-70 family RNA polymerase sigma factor [Ktedonobacteraceae bacterium]